MGKQLHGLRPPDTSGRPRIFWGLKREWITAGDLQPFLAEWDIARLQKLGGLPAIFANVTFCITGYDDDDRDLTEIPEVRAYLIRLIDVWPYFFFTDDLDSEFLRLLILAVVPNLQVLHRGDEVGYKFEMDEIDRVSAKLEAGLWQLKVMQPTIPRNILKLQSAAVQSHLDMLFGRSH